MQPMATTSITTLPWPRSPPQTGQSIVHEECGGMDDSSSPSGAGEIISCARSPVMERRLRPQHDQPLKCPRCDSTHTKFCYYNNYSLSQPRYFCKTCRRYWTKGGSLRNVPVGGGCRKNKRPGAKKPPEQQHAPPPLPLNPLTAGASSFCDGADLHLSSSFPALHLSHLGSLASGPHIGLNLLECKYDAMFESHGGVDGGEFGAVLGNPRNLLFLGGGGGGDVVRGMGGTLGELGHGFPSSSGFDAGVSPLGFPVEGNGNSSGGGMFMSSCQRLGLPLDGQEEDHNAVEMKPSTSKLLSLEWQDQGCADVGRDGFGYSGGLGLWAGVMNSHGASTSNPLI
ncbi:hypothetical protein Taro_008209 [Colocasia esculenta]|uniref:Dof zinc finger protein n=1 Tax=Colocasia esculenta TaxID=4460 RepID=A0A843TWF6_COLES|nr:hypothetical protein [Colocasia esculenta]